MPQDADDQKQELTMADVCQTKEHLLPIF